MPNLTREERIQRATQRLAAAEIELAALPASGRERTYSIARIRSALRAARAALTVLVRARAAYDAEAQILWQRTDQLWPSPQTGRNP